jgi:drug/metabolite transporter (DMT)-like permease
MSPRAWILFTLCSVIWGVPYVFIKVAVDAGLPPAFVAWSRIALAAALLVPLAWHRGALRGLRGRESSILAYAACEVAVPFVLIAAGERYISSSLTAILVATMPLMVALFSLRLSPAERPTGRRLLGLLLGFGGVVALLGVDVAGRSAELLGAALVLLATLGYAVAALIVSRRLADLDPLGAVAASLTVATFALLPAAIVTPPDGPPRPAALAAIGVLGIVCTAAGLLIFFRLITDAGPGRASVITYVNPLVAVVVGVLALGERLGVVSIAGLALILGGSWLSTEGRRRFTDRPAS